MKRWCWRGDSNPMRVISLEPESSVSANFTTPASIRLFLKAIFSQVFIQSKIISVLHCIKSKLSDTNLVHKNK